MIFSNPVSHSRHRLVVANPIAPNSIYCNLQNYRYKSRNDILNTVYVQCSLHLLKARTPMDHIFFCCCCCCCCLFFLGGGGGGGGVQALMISHYSGLTTFAKNTNFAMPFFYERIYKLIYVLYTTFICLPSS